MADTPQAGSTTAQKIRDVWNVAEVIIEELVVAAESMQHLATDADKKAFIKTTVLSFLHNIEDKQHLLPSYAETLAFKAIEFALDFIIDRLVAKHAAATPTPATPAKAA